MLAKGEPGIVYGQPKAFMNLARESSLEPGEIEALQSSLAASDQVATVEAELMRSFAASGARPADPGNATRTAPMYRRLAGPEYFTGRNAIAGGVEPFNDLVDHRTHDALDALRERSGKLLTWQLGFVASLLMFILAILLVVYRGWRLRRETAARERVENEFRSEQRQIGAALARKWDGSGYPRGLSGVDIPLAGRIVAIADVFDALTSERPYKPAWPLEKVLALFQEQRGRHFDPKLVDLMQELVPQFLEVRPTRAPRAPGAA